MPLPVARLLPERQYYCRQSSSGHFPEGRRDFTFIMAVPLMFLACFYDLLKVIGSLSVGDLGVLAVGFVTAFVVAYASILWFLKFLNTST